MVFASSAVFMAWSTPGMMGTSAAMAICLEEILSPMAFMLATVGPMKVMPFFSQASTKLGFSARKP